MPEQLRVLLKYYDLSFNIIYMLGVQFALTVDFKIGLLGKKPVRLESFFILLG